MLSKLFPSSRAPQPAPSPAISPVSSFADLGLADPIRRGAEAAGYTSPTPIQQQAIPIALAGKDLIGSAQTGTGKTAAFALPILSRLGQHRRGAARVLVLEPTRELAMQVHDAFREYSRHTDLRAAAFYGGVGYGKQREDLRRGVDIIIATPGRLLDYVTQREISLGGIDILVLDEVDRMLDMGFLPDVRRLVEQCPPREKRQTLFFSATLPPEIGRLTEWALRPNPEIIEIGERRSPAETVTHAFYPVATAQKFDLLISLLERTQYHSVLIFARTKHGSDRIAGKLKTAGHSVAVLHGNRSQNQRIEALAGFKNGKYEVMVATDIAARGIDVDGVTHVINYDIPKNPEDYVHRIGRTGRAQREGDAFTLITQDDAEAARDVERYLGERVRREQIEGFPYVAIPATTETKPAKGGRGGGRGARNGWNKRAPTSQGRRSR
jgi:superfamily II DNA/RNA helicase